MSGDPGQADQAVDLGVTPGPDSVAAHADGRPPEAPSDNPMAQTRTIEKVQG